jgi:hypothetical protein
MSFRRFVRTVNGRVVCLAEPFDHDAKEGFLNQEAQLIVYFAQCPTHGPEHRFYGAEDFRRAGSVQSLESEIEAETYWFARLGTISAHPESVGGSGRFVFSDHDIAGLPDPRPSDCRAGRRNPAFGLSELELQIFESIFRAAATSLCEWKSNADDGSVGYAIKEVKVDSDHIGKLASALTANGTTTDVVQMAVLKYELDLKFPSRSLTCDDILDEFPVVAVVQLRWNAREKAIASKVLSLSMSHSEVAESA